VAFGVRIIDCFSAANAVTANKRHEPTFALGPALSHTGHRISLVQFQSASTAAVSVSIGLECRTC